MALVLDTGVLYSSLDRREASHRACRELLEGSTEELIIPAPVLPEVDYFITDRLHPAVLIALLRDIELGNFRVLDLTMVDYNRVDELVTQYMDSQIGFVDAAVLALVERLKETKLATLDHRHFGMMRPKHVESLTLLP